jgi:hypothetical protein
MFYAGQYKTDNTETLQQILSLKAREYGLERPYFLLIMLV